MANLQSNSDVSVLPWAQPGWRETAEAWIRAELRGCGWRVTGDITEAHVRPWSAVLRAPTDDGDIYFKATAPALAHEAALSVALARWRPDYMSEIIAADGGRGWLLMRDGGTTLRQFVSTDRDMRRWHKALTQYAELQIELAQHGGDLLALGVPDQRLTTLPAHYENLLAETALLRIGEPQGLTANEYARLQLLAPRFARLCAELAAFGLPETLDHNDFHDGNIFVRGERLIFFDWGDACLTHPFLTLVVVLRSVAFRLQIPQDAPEVAQARDAYLEPWTRFAPRERLLEACTIAWKIGAVCRALAWRRALSAVGESARAGDRDAVSGWLQEFLAVAG